MSQVARNLDLTASAVRAWVTAADPKESTLADNPESEELKQLRADNKRLRMEREYPGKGHRLPRQGVDMKLRFVETEKANYQVTLISRMLTFSPKSYYAWRSREPSARQLETERLLVQIREAFERGRGTYGSPRVHAELQESGIKIGLNRVAALMRSMGLLRAAQKGFSGLHDRAGSGT